MIRKVKQTVEKFNMLENVKEVVVGLSGGADSVALTHILIALSEEYGFTLTAAHINHGIRGEEAIRDEQFVRSFCEMNSITLKVLNADIPSLSSETGESVEECGRRVRYEFFNSLAGENGVIATAHNLNDSVETFFLNLVRGTGLRGLCGIPAKRGNIIRPLIDCTRDEIEEYCKQNSLDFVTDSSNLNDEYSRNLIRHRIIPELEKINTSFLSVMQRNLENLCEDEDFIISASEGFLSSFCKDGKVRCNDLSALPESVKKRVISKLCADCFGFLPEKKHIELIDSILLNGGAVELRYGCFAQNVNGELVFKQKAEDIPPFEVEVDLKNSSVSYPYGRIVFESADEYLKDLQIVQKNVLENIFDCDKISGKVFLRSRREGDRISLFSRGVSKSLKKLFIEKKIPIEYRNKIAVLADDNGVFYVEGCGIDERVKITDGTKNAVRIKKGE